MEAVLSQKLKELLTLIFHEVGQTKETFKMRWRCLSILQIQSRSDKVNISLAYRSGL